jgi:hypothetical protein
VRKLLVFLVLFVSIPSFAASVNLIWDYDYTNDTPCQAGQTTNCLSHFIAYHYDASNNRVTDKTVTASPTAAGQVTGIQTGFFPLSNKYGSMSFYVVAVARDATGALIESDEASTIATIRPSKPKNPRNQVQ